MGHGQSPRDHLEAAESFNPTKYIRHYSFTAYIASNGGSHSWDDSTSRAADTSWLVDQPWE